MRVFWLGVIFFCVATAAAPVGSATTQDDNFLAMLADAGIPAHDGIPSVIAAGHEVCTELDSGQPASAIADKLANDAYADAPVNSLDQYQRSMVRFVQVSTQAFCPAHAGGAAWHGRYRAVPVDDVVVPTPLPALPGEPNVAHLKPPPVAAPPSHNPPPRVKPPPPEQSPPPAQGPQGGGQSGGGQSGDGDDGDGGGAQPAPPLPGGHIVLLP